LWYVYRGRLAHYLSLRGRDAEAWGIIEPGLRTGQGAVMRWGAEILEKLGRTEEAHALARQAVDRYPDAADTRAVLASMLWRGKRYSEAALVLDPPEAGYKVSDDAFRTDVAPRFAEIFARAPDETVESAFAALRGQGVRTQRVASLLPPLAAAGRNELAFRLQTQLASPHQHPWEIADWRREGFGYLEKAQGRAAAVAWIQAALPAAQLDNTLSSMFNKKAWPFLWDVVSPADEPKVSEWSWVFRAGAAAVDPATSAAHRPMLLEHYRESRPGQTTWTIGRYLLGLEERQAVLASVKTEDGRCGAAYFLGLKDISSGRYEDASDWFQLVNAICSKPPSWGFVAFAHTTTSEWSKFDRDLRTAAARKVW
jgi:tetratricopeptide (TPR) repeat protein